MATSIRVSFAPRRTQRANRWPNIAPSSRGATSRPIDMPVPTIKICSSTCTMVCQTGISAPPTAFLTDGTVVVRVRSSHQITAAMEAPTVTEIARRMAGTLNGPDSCAFSMYPSAKRSTWYSMSVSRPAAAPIAMPIMATAAISPGIRPIVGCCSVSSCDCFDTLASPTLHAPRLQSVSSYVLPHHHRSTDGGFIRQHPPPEHEFQCQSHNLRLHSERPIRLVVLGNKAGHIRQTP